MVSEECAGRIELARRGAEIAGFKLSSVVEARAVEQPFSDADTGSILRDACEEMERALVWLAQARAEVQRGL